VSDGKPRRLIEFLELAAGHLASKGIDTARLDAELLLAEVLGLSRVELYTNYDRPLTPDEVDRYRELLRRRARREPVAYILGRKEFWSLEFAVDRRVLVPRPETETLVEEVLAFARSRPVERILDIGTGCGAVAVALAVELPACRVVATDASAAVLEVAPGNARRHGVADRIEFRLGDLFAAVAEGERFDVVVSNPPYCREDELDGLEPEVRDWEPRPALAAGPDGMAVTGRIIDEAPRVLRPEGRLFLEVGTQAELVRRRLAERGWREIAVRADLAGRPRVVAAAAPV